MGLGQLRSCCVTELMIGVLAWSEKCHPFACHKAEDWRSLAVEATSLSTINPQVSVIELTGWFYLEHRTYCCRGYLKLATWMDREASGPRGLVGIPALENTSLLCARWTSRLWEIEGIIDTQSWVRGLFRCRARGLEAQGALISVTWQVG